MSVQETYPDVTQPLNTPIPNSNCAANSMDTVVILQRPQQRGEMCVKDGLNPLSDTGRSEPHSQDPESQDGPNSNGSNATSAVHYPSSMIRLPRSLIPSHYDLDLKIKLEDTETPSFSGSCNISVVANTSTRSVVFHRSDLALDESRVRVRSELGREEWKVVKQYHVTDNEFHVLELERELPKGQRFRIEVGSFKGLIRDDLRGLYKSSYKTKNGKKRSVNIV
nr:hypothetical protein BaRGS_034745 [Batillaria attramentaria]